MFTEYMTTLDDLIAIRCEGKLSEDEIKQVHALLHRRLEEGPMPGLVVDLTGFDGFEGAAALWEDLKMESSHRNDFRRVAVIGEARWIEWATPLVAVLTRAEMRWFASDETEQAAQWARDG